jgi:hypothetical protein
MLPMMIRSLQDGFFWHIASQTLVTPSDSEHIQAQDSWSTVHEVFEVARPTQSDEEFQEFEDLITGYKDTFATDSEDYGQTVQTRETPCRSANPKETASGGTDRGEHHARVLKRKCTSRTELV